jgi:hypothetical protein
MVPASPPRATAPPRAASEQAVSLNRGRNNLTFEKSNPLVSRDPKGSAPALPFGSRLTKGSRFTRFADAPLAHHLQFELSLLYRCSAVDRFIDQLAGDSARGFE